MLLLCFILFCCLLPTIVGQTLRGQRKRKTTWVYTTLRRPQAQLGGNFHLFTDIGLTHDTTAIGTPWQRHNKIRRKTTMRISYSSLNVRRTSSNSLQQTYRRSVGAFTPHVSAHFCVSSHVKSSPEISGKKKIVNPLSVSYDFEFYSSPICCHNLFFRVFK